MYNINSLRLLSLTAYIGAVIFATLPAAAKQFQPKTTLTAATIFTDRATLTREAILTLEAGDHTIEFENLPATLSPDSLRVAGHGNAKATLGALSYKYKNSIDLIGEQEQQLNTQKEALENKKTVLNANKKALVQKSDFLSSLQAQASDKIVTEKIADFTLDADKWIQTADSVLTALNEAYLAQINIDSEIAKINKQLQKIEQDMRQLRTGQKRSLYATMPITVREGGKLTLTLSYQLPNISWHPVYDARLDLQNESLTLTQFGAITQKTGEDWTDIKITLSTAQPQRGATVPPSTAHWVTLRQNQQPGFMKRNNYASSISKIVIAEDSALNVEKEIMQQDAIINTSGFNAEYQIPATASIPSDGSETKVLIGAFETQTDLELHIKPQVNNHAYLIAQTTLNGDAPILAGMVNLFRDGAFIGQTGIPMLRPGERQDLSFGIDDQISVKQKLLKDEAGEDGILIGKTNTVQKQTATEIQNLRKKPVKITVLQNIPVARNEDIKISIDDKKTTPAYTSDHDNIKGLLAWTFTLEPTAKKDVILDYAVSWPKDSVINNLR